MPFSILISRLCARAHMRYFPFDVTSPSIGMIDLDCKRDVDGPKIKRNKLKTLGEPSSVRSTVDAPTPAELGNASTREETIPERSSS